MRYLIVLYSLVTSRMSGGGLGAAHLPSAVPEILFALPFGYSAYVLSGNYYLAPLAIVWAYLWMQTGHGTAYHMGRHPELAVGRKQTLSKVIDPICKLLNAEIGGTLYAWLFMGLKGLLIGLAAFPFGLGLALLWPLSYDIGWRMKKFYKPTEIGEYLSGAAAGLALALNVIH